MTRRQCAKCPWRKDVDPRDIPNGYCEKQHAALRNTVATGIESLTDTIRLMACHETPVGRELPCVGWLVNQLQNNNLGLRLAVFAGRISADVRTVGEQHATLEETLPP